MDGSIKLSRIDDTLAQLSYPVSREAASSALADVTLRVADGEENLGSLVADVDGESFDSVDELRDELYGHLPESAIGEPGQSEGDA